MEVEEAHRIQVTSFNGRVTGKCACGAKFGAQSEIRAHQIAVKPDESRLLNCIARQTHCPQPVEMVYEMRGQRTAHGDSVPSPVDGSEWMLAPQSSAERSRITAFECPNCQHRTEVK